MTAPAGLRVAARCLALDTLAIDTARLFTEQGISCLLLKGPATSRRLYGEDSSVRVYSDVDLLVAPHVFDAAERSLAAAGYHSRLVGIREDEMPWHESAWRSPDADLTVDLHRGFAGVGDPGELWRLLWSRRESMKLNGSDIAVPDLVGTALILGLHAATPGRARRPAADLQRGFAVFDRAVWVFAADLARQVDGASAYRAGVELLPGGTALVREMGLTGPVQVDQWLAGRHASRVTVNLAKAMQVPGSKARLRFLMRKLFPSAAWLRIADPLARNGLRGLIAGYVRRWRWVVRSAPAAVMEVRLARIARRADESNDFETGVTGVNNFIRACVFDPRGGMAGGWAVYTHLRVRRVLRRRPLAEVDLPGPPWTGSLGRALVVAVLRRRRASCLERSLVLQRFDAAAGRDRTLIVAVSAPGPDFRAHSWLEGDPANTNDLREIHRRPAPPHWLRPSRSSSK